MRIGGDHNDIAITIGKLGDPVGIVFLDLWRCVI